MAVTSSQAWEIAVAIQVFGNLLPEPLESPGREWRSWLVHSCLCTGVALGKGTCGWRALLKGTPANPCIQPQKKGYPASGRGDASWRWDPWSQSHGTTQQLPSFKNKKLLQCHREDHRSEHPAEVSVLPLSPLPFGPYCDKPLGCKTIKMLITSHQEAQPLILIYELPTFKAQCSSDHVLHRWSRVPRFNSPLQAAGALSVANTLWRMGRAQVCKSTWSWHRSASTVRFVKPNHSISGRQDSVTCKFAYSPCLELSNRNSLLLNALPVARKPG